MQDRPILGEAVRLIEQSDAGELMLPRLDRIARQLTVQEAVLAMVWQLGGRVFAADQREILQDDPDYPIRTAIRQMQGVFAELDRRMLVKRMRDGIRAKRAQGRHDGHLPLRLPRPPARPAGRRRARRPRAAGTCEFSLPTLKKR